MLRQTVKVNTVEVKTTYKQPVLSCGHNARLIKGRVRKAYNCFICKRAEANKKKKNDEDYLE